jgi:transcriptional regulator
MLGFFGGLEGLTSRQVEYDLLLRSHKAHGDEIARLKTSLQTEISTLSVNVDTKIAKAEADLRGLVTKIDESFSEKLDEVHKELQDYKG